MSLSWNVLVPGLGLWRLGRRRLGGVLGATYALAMIGTVVILLRAAGGPWAWLVILPAGAMGAVFALSQILLRNELSIRLEPAWRLHVASLRETIEAHMERGRSAEALEVIDDWLREDPHSAEAWVFRARLDAANGRLERARQDYQRAARCDEDRRFGEEIRHALEVLGGSSR